MCRDTFCTFGPKLRTINRGGGGGAGKSIQVGKGLFNWSPKVSVVEPLGLQEKSYCSRSLKFDTMHQPQLKMLLLLHLWKELLQI